MYGYDKAWIYEIVISKYKSSFCFEHVERKDGQIFGGLLAPPHISDWAFGPGPKFAAARVTGPITGYWKALVTVEALERLFTGVNLDVSQLVVFVERHLVADSTLVRHPTLFVDDLFYLEAKTK